MIPLHVSRFVITIRICYIILIIALSIMVYLVASRELINDITGTNDCKNNLVSICYAIKDYKEAQGNLPPLYTSNADDSLMHSWRALILPYIVDETEEQYDYTKSWNDNSNLKLSAKAPYMFRCPIAYVNEVPEGECSYFILVPDLHASAEMPSPFIIVEHPNSQINWLEPRDITCSEFLKVLKAYNFMTHHDDVGEFHIYHEFNEFNRYNIDELIPIIEEYNATY